MKICLYDGSINGFFTAAFMLYRNGIMPDIITDSKNIQIDFNIQIYEYGTDNEKAKRIAKFIKKHTKAEGYNSFIYTLSGFKENKGKIAYCYLTVILEHKEKAPFMLNDKRVIDFFDICNAVKFEIHRMEGFLHFKQCKNEIYYAEFEPDNNITEFLMPHFTQRFCSMSFIIHDIKRNIVGIYNGKEYKVFNNKGVLTVYLSENEESFLKIWKMYYNTINIPGRKNLKVMKNYLPKRYWRCMPEKNE